MSVTVENLFEKAAGAKRRGDFQEAFDYYKQAIEMNPTSHAAFVHFGKVAYLLGQLGIAGKSYLAATHLQLCSIARALENNTLPPELEMIYKGFPQEMLDSLPNKAAFILYVDQTLCHHFGHVLVDLNEEYVGQNPHLHPYIEVYKAKISEDGSFHIMMNMNGLNEEDIKKVDLEFYIGIGRKMFLDNIQWDKIMQENAISLYF